MLDKLTSKGAQVVGISIDSQFVQKEFAARSDLGYPLLSDANREAARAFDVVLGEVAGIRDVADRAVFVFQGGVVTYRWMGEVSGQPDPAAVVAALG